MPHRGRDRRAGPRRPRATASRSRSATCRPRSSGRTCCQPGWPTSGGPLAWRWPISTPSRRSSGPVRCCRCGWRRSSRRPSGPSRCWPPITTGCRRHWSGSPARRQWTVRATASAPRGTDARPAAARTTCVRWPRDVTTPRRATQRTRPPRPSCTRPWLTCRWRPSGTRHPRRGQLLSGVYLVRAEQTGRFQEVLSQAREHPDALNLDVRGPLAPYSFVPRLEEAA